MSFNKYYQDELSFLREMGREFAQANPAAAQFLADRGSDPDVERLLEGFAFLTGRVRQKLDDEFPELVHAVMNLLWPHYLRPIPSISMIEFSPIPGAVSERQRIPRGAEVASIPVEGTACRFRTCFDLDLYPLEIRDAGLRTLADGRTGLRLQFAVMAGAKLLEMNLESLRFHLQGESAYTLYLWLCRYVSDIRLRTIINGKPGREITLPSSEIRPVGFAKEEALLPYPKTAFDGYRLVQEYFSFPEKFLFMELSGLDPLSRMTTEEIFEVDFVFSRPPSSSMKVSRDNIRLYCSPVVNLFPLESDPIRVSHDRVEYRVRPAGSNVTHYEIYSVDGAQGWIQGTAEERVYEPFYSFKHGLGPESRKETYYQRRFRNAVVGDGVDTYVSFVNGEQTTVLPPTETVVFRLTCTNRALAVKVRVGDIKIPTGTSPEFARFRNISKVSSSIHPQVGGDLYWRLISHLSLNYISLLEVDALRGILGLYNFQSFYDRQAAQANERRLQGIVKIESRGEDHLFHGVPIRGTLAQIDMREDHFSDEGDMFLFTSVLNEFLSLYASLNSFTRLSVRGVQEGEIYQWTPRIGNQITL